MQDAMEEVNCEEGTTNNVKAAAKKKKEVVSLTNESYNEIFTAVINQGILEASKPDLHDAHTPGSQDSSKTDEQNSQSHEQQPYMEKESNKDRETQKKSFNFPVPVPKMKNQVVNKNMNASKFSAPTKSATKGEKKAFVPPNINKTNFKTPGFHPPKPTAHAEVADNEKSDETSKAKKTQKNKSDKLKKAASNKSVKRTRELDNNNDGEPSAKTHKQCEVAEESIKKKAPTPKISQNSGIRNSKQVSQGSDISRILSLSQDLSGSQVVQLSQPPRGINQRQRLEWLRDRRNTGTWVQCDKPHCAKWRYLANTKDPVDVPAYWTCSMHLDPKYNSCDKPEKGPTIVEEVDLIDNRYTAGSVVWARVPGYPWWPALVDDDPDVEQYYWLNGFSDIPTHYHVAFFDQKEVTRAWVTPNSMDTFKGKENHNTFRSCVNKSTDYAERLKFAIEQGIAASKLSIQERLKKYGFIARYKGPVGKKKSVASVQSSSSSSSSDSDSDSDSNIDVENSPKSNTRKKKLQDSLEKVKAIKKSLLHTKNKSNCTKEKTSAKSKCAEKSLKLCAKSPTAKEDSIFNPPVLTPITNDRAQSSDHDKKERVSSNTDMPGLTCEAPLATECPRSNSPVAEPDTDATYFSKPTEYDSFSHIVTIGTEPARLPKTNGAVDVEIEENHEGSVCKTLTSAADSSTNAGHVAQQEDSLHSSPETVTIQEADTSERLTESSFSLPSIYKLRNSIMIGQSIAPALSGVSNSQNTQNTRSETDANTTDEAAQNEEEDEAVVPNITCNDSDSDPFEAEE